MGSEFQKLIRKVFGRKAYVKYATFVRNNIRRRTEESRTVYNEIYKGLEGISPDILKAMHEQLTEVMIDVVRIGKNFYLAAVTCIAAIAFLLIMSLDYPVTVISVTLISTVFLYKLYEFLVNKFCYVDARIILVYKTALENLLNSEKEETGEQA